MIQYTFQFADWYSIRCPHQQLHECRSIFQKVFVYKIGGSKQLMASLTGASFGLNENFTAEPLSPKFTSY